MSVRAVIFDAGVLLGARRSVIGELTELLAKLRELEILVAVFSTEPVDVNGLLDTWGQPAADLQLTRDDVGKNKGSPAWIDKACAELEVSRHELIYVGDSDLDWRTAINSAVMYFHAEWAGRPIRRPGFRAQSPNELWHDLSHFFLQPPRWQYRIDDGHSTHIRALLNATTTLSNQVSPTGEVTQRFTLQQIFTYERDIRVGGVPAKALLMWHAISSLYLEGLVPPGVLIASYPSHKAGKLEGILDDWLTPAAKVFHGWYTSDLLVRATEAPDTSRLRWQGKAATPEMQMSTVHINPDYQRRLRDKTVILLDDFTTDGTSLEWGKSLLQAAGVARVILVTIGKYGQMQPIRHRSFRLKPGIVINPFESTSRSFAEVFQASRVNFQEDLLASLRLGQSLKHLAEGKAYPISP